jgi:hypothetical protein
MTKFLLFTLLVFISCSLKAQNWEIGGALGGAGYMGDLNINNPVKVSGPSIGGFVTYNFDGYWLVRLNGTVGNISAADSNSSSQQFRNRNLSFSSLLIEGGILGQFNFMKYIPEIGKNKFTPYIFFGFSALDFRTSTIYKGQKIYLKGLETEGEKKPYSNKAFSFPYGAGIKYNILGSFTLGAEIGYRNPNTDYLDDVSGNYADLTKSSAIVKALGDRSGEKTGVYIGTPGTQRGDLVPRDTYFFTQITLSYTFISQKCYFHN